MIYVIHIYMQERRKTFYESITDRTAEQYKGSYANVHARRRLYRHAQPPIDLPAGFRPGLGLHPSLEAQSDELKPTLAKVAEKVDEETIAIEHKILALADLKGDERVLDVGCSDGAFLRFLALVHGHKGDMIGIDKFYHSEFSEHLYLGDGHQLPIEFFTNDAEKQIFLPDNSVDIVFNKFVLYHTQDPQKILDECWRVAKPDSKVVIATRGVNNMYRLWEGADQVGDGLAARLNVQKNWHIRSYYHDFDLPAAIEEFEKRFEITECYEQSAKATGSRLVLDASWGWMDFHSGILSLMPEFRNIARMAGLDLNNDAAQRLFLNILLDTIEETIRPDILWEIKQNQYFTDGVEQLILIGKPKNKRAIL